LELTDVARRSVRMIELLPVSRFIENAIQIAFTLEMTLRYGKCRHRPLAS
jgi:hypothetical protein